MKGKLSFLWTTLCFGLLILSVGFSATGQAAPANTSEEPQIEAGSAVCNLVRPYTNPVLSPGMAVMWDGAGVSDPAVIYAGGNYKMYYSGTDNNGDSAIGLATSPDGIAWTKVGKLFSNLTSCSENGARAGTVLFDGGVYKMWFQGRGADGAWRVCYATSPNGMTWTGNATPVLSRGASGAWDSAWVRNPTVLLDGSAYHLWYTGSQGSTTQIGHATSPDGIAWTKAANPVLVYGPIAAWDWLGSYAPSVVKAGSEFVMFYSGAALPPKWSTGYALSTDGVNWQRAARIIPQGKPGEFDELSAEYSAVLLESGKYRFWYSGLSATDVQSIGYAEADACSGAPPTGNYSYLPVVNRGRPQVYTDNFSNSTSGWVNYSDADFDFGYVDGEYQINLKKPNWWGWESAGALAETYVVEVNVRRTANTDGGYGLIFDVEKGHEDNFLIFIVKDGYFSVQRYQAPDWYYEQSWTASSAINPGTAWNKLKLVISTRGYPQVYANDVLLWAAAVQTQGAGRQVGLTALSPSNSAIDVRFDNFIMYRYGDTPGNIITNAPVVTTGAAPRYPFPLLHEDGQVTKPGGGYFDSGLRR